MTPEESSWEMVPILAMDSMMTSVMTGGSGALVFAGLMYWVTRRMQLMGLVWRTLI
jgi:hypothetical protein